MQKRLPSALVQVHAYPTVHTQNTRFLTYILLLETGSLPPNTVFFSVSLLVLHLSLPFCPSLISVSLFAYLPPSSVCTWCGVFQWTTPVATPLLYKTESPDRLELHQADKAGWPVSPRDDLPISVAHLNLTAITSTHHHAHLFTWFRGSHSDSHTSKARTSPMEPSPSPRTEVSDRSIEMKQLSSVTISKSHS